MSGGHFNYAQYRIADIVEGIESAIKGNGIKDEYGYANSYSKKTLKEFKKGIYFLKKAQIFAHEIDWLISGDNGEDSFMENLTQDLLKLDAEHIKKRKKNVK